MKKNNALDKLFETVIEVLQEKLDDRETVTPADISNAIKLLKDSGWSADVESHPRLNAISRSYPFREVTEQEMSG